MRRSKCARKQLFFSYACAMAAMVVGEVLGPRPGLAIVSFSQGLVEIALRVACVVVSASL